MKDVIDVPDAFLVVQNGMVISPYLFEDTIFDYLSHNPGNAIDEEYVRNIRTGKTVYIWNSETWQWILQPL